MKSYQDLREMMLFIFEERTQLAEEEEDELIRYSLVSTRRTICTKYQINMEEEKLALRNLSTIQVICRKIAL